LDARAAVFMTPDEFDSWLHAHGGTEREVVIGVFKARSGKRIATLEALQETALCCGWVDTQNQRIDEDRYAIRFVPRRAGSTWGPKNRRLARRMLDQHRMEPSGLATLPDDL
jgi:uncharacterized protein YdeI (YjbR/CyaY-like superfamily)